MALYADPFQQSQILYDHSSEPAVATNLETVEWVEVWAASSYKLSTVFLPLDKILLIPQTLPFSGSMLEELMCYIGHLLLVCLSV